MKVALLIRRRYSVAGDSTDLLPDCTTTSGKVAAALILQRNVMSKGTVIIAISIAFVGGLAIGHLTGKSAGNEAGAAAAGAAAAGPEEGVERFKVVLNGKYPSKGPDDALVTVVELSDFECPFCSRVEPTVSRLMSEYKGKLRVVWMNNPLPFHPNAGPAAEAALEAFSQGGNEKFWKMHALMFENQRALGRPELERYAEKVGLDMGKFRAALDNHSHKAKVAADQALAERFDARGTPAFFINGRKLMGAQPFEQFKTLVDEEIKRAEALLSTGVSKKRLYAEIISRGLGEAERPKPSQPQDAPKPSQPDPAAVYRVPVDKEPQRGPEDALVTIVEVSDFECPFCARVEPTMTQIVEKYGRDVRVVWFNNPLPFHSNAGPAAQAALEAFAQGGNAKFWKMHALLFEHQSELSRDNLEKYAKELGLNLPKFKKALDEKVHQPAIDKQQALARSLGANGTPSFFINGRNLRGAQPFEAFAAVIDEELKKAKDLVAKGTPKSKVYAAIIEGGATAPKFLDKPPEEAGEADEANKVYKIAVPADAPRKGGKKAKVVIQEFSDFQCPFCGRVGPTVAKIIEEYGDKVQIVWRNYPLPFHQQAMPAAEASLEVYRQGGSKKFWAYHDLLFQNQQALERADLEKYATQVGGIDLGKFRAALDDHRHKKAVEADVEAVQKAGAQIGTPSFFINGRLLQGAQPFEAFKAIIDRELG